jgi:hypothetical protein
MSIKTTYESLDAVARIAVRNLPAHVLRAYMGEPTASDLEEAGLVESYKGTGGESLRLTNYGKQVQKYARER